MRRAVQLCAAAVTARTVARRPSRLVLCGGTCQFAKLWGPAVQLSTWSVGRTEGDEQRSRLSSHPVPRLLARGCECNDLDVLGSFAIHQVERKPSQKDATRRRFSSYLRYGVPDLRVRSDQRDKSLNLVPQFLSQSRASVFVPPNFGTDFRISGRIRPNGFGQRPKISRSIRRRTSSQSRVVVRPASRSAQRFSISAAHAASTSSSFSRSKLSSRRAATSARSLSGRSSASRSNCSTVRAIAQKSNTHVSGRPSNSTRSSRRGPALARRFRASRFGATM